MEDNKEHWRTKKVEPIESDKITLQHIKDAVEYIMKSAPPKTDERKVKFATGCDYYGLTMRTGDDPFIRTCGNKNCQGCYTFLENINKAFKEEVERIQFKLFDDGK